MLTQKFYLRWTLIGILLTLILGWGWATAQEAPPIPRPLFSATSPFNQAIPPDAVYTVEERIGTFRHNMAEWSMPVYRVGEAEEVPLVEVINDYSGRVEQWPIPRYAEPAIADDHHMAVIYPSEGILYEMWNARWEDDPTGESLIRSGGAVSFPLSGLGVSDPPNRRVTAAGFAVMAGMVIMEDFTDPATGELDLNASIDHALSMSLPFQIVETSAFIPPAVGGEVSGQAGLGGIPMGARFALSPDLDVDSLGVHPFTRALLRAARDYGIYVNDTNGSPLYSGKYIGQIRIEPGLLEAVYGVDGDDFIERIQTEVFGVIQNFGIYRVTLAGEPLPIDPSAAPAQSEPEAEVSSEDETGVSQTSGVRPSVVISPAYLEVAEGGAGLSYTLALNASPEGVMLVIVNTDHQTYSDRTLIVFTAQNWNVPQSVTITAYDDTDSEGSHQAFVRHMAVYPDGTHDPDAAEILILIEDND